MSGATIHPNFATLLGAKYVAEAMNSHGFRRFNGRAGKYQIPRDAIVEVVRFYPRRRALVKWQGQEILTFTTLLRRLTP